MLHHEEWKAQALPKINTQAPSDFHHITNGKLEREIKSREKKIREENLIMLGKFYKILNVRGRGKGIERLNEGAVALCHQFEPH